MPQDRRVHHGPVWAEGRPAGGERPTAAHAPSPSPCRTLSSPRTPVGNARIPLLTPFPALSRGLLSRGPVFTLPFPPWACGPPEGTQSAYPSGSVGPRVFLAQPERTWTRTLLARPRMRRGHYRADPSLLPQALTPQVRENRRPCPQPVRTPKCRQVRRFLSLVLLSASLGTVFTRVCPGGPRAAGSEPLTTCPERCVRRRRVPG